MAKIMIKRTKPAPPKRKAGYSKSYDPWTDGVRQSLLLEWLECRQRARAHVILNLESKHLSKPLTFGDLSHQCIASCYLAINRGELKFHEDAAQMVPTWIDWAIACFKQEHSITKFTTDQEDLIEECASILQALLPGYFKHWWERDKKEVEWLGVEEEFSFKPEGFDAPITGTIDGRFKKKSTGGIWVLETKNKGRWNEDALIDWLPLDLQCQMYQVACKYISKKTPAGVRYNILRRPQERRKVAESLKDFTARIQDNATKKPEHYYVRIDMQTTKAEVEAAENRLRHLTHEFLTWWDTIQGVDKKTLDPMYNSAACESKYGTCQYLRFCASGATDGLE
jgi:PD-(D/E)XK nuclease superfamily